MSIHAKCVEIVLAPELKTDFNGFCLLEKVESETCEQTIPFTMTIGQLTLAMKTEDNILACIFFSACLVML